VTSSRANSARRALWACVLAAVLAVALALAACGGGEGGGTGTAAGGRPPSANELRLVVSRDFGAEVLRDVVVPAGDKSDALRVLAENAEVDTGYGGQFVNGIDGLESSFGGVSSADAADWFYWVDGVLGDVGAADWKLTGGETVWWDYHRWADAMILPLALHAFPRPFTGRALEVTAAGEVAGLGDWAAANGIELAPREPLGTQAPAGGLVLATAAEATAAPWLLDLLDASRTGVEMIRIDAKGLRVVSPDGTQGPAATGAAVVVGGLDDPARPYLVVLGATAADLEAFVAQLTPETLNASVAVAQVDDAILHLPWQGK
jgi:hypothetical protein